MKWIATECAWFAAFLLKPLLNLANRFIDMRIVYSAGIATVI
jgi:hypothetical protein